MKNYLKSISNWITGKVRERVQVVANPGCQPHVLEARMEAAELRHLDTVIADINQVRLEKRNGEMAIYFCHVSGIDVKEVLATGDGGGLAQHARVENLTVPKGIKQGMYNLKNVQLVSNGVMTITATKKTKLELLK